MLTFSDPLVLNAVMVPRLLRGGSPLPAYAAAVAVPAWDNVPIAFAGVASALSFTGMQAAQLLHGVHYTLSLTVTLDGLPAGPMSACAQPPYSYSYATSPFSLASCAVGLLGLNFTQQCGACPAHASCAGTQIFAQRLGRVWRPTSDALPFALCPPGSGGCGLPSTSTATERIGFECSSGYEGPLCGQCADGDGRSGTAQCARCAPTAVNSAVVALMCVIAFGVVTFSSVVGAAAAGTKAKSRWRDVGMYAVRLFTNHFSLFGILAHTEVAASISETVRQSLLAQNAACTPSPTQSSFFGCLAPHWTVNDVFLLAMSAVPALVAVDAIIARARHGRWALMAVSSVVLQLTYVQVMQVAAKLLRRRTMTFFESTPYLVNGTSANATAHYDLLESDVRINFGENTTYFASAWLVLILCGLGIPLWFIAAYWITRRRESSEAAQAKLRFLVKNYREECWFWESVVAARKGLSIMIVGALATYPVVQVQAISILYTLYLGLLEKYRPHSSSSRTMAERASYAAAIFTSNAMLAVYSVDATSSGTNASGDASFVALVIAVQVAAVLVLCRVIYMDIVEVRSQQDDDDDEDRPINGSSDDPADSVDLPIGPVTASSKHFSATRHAEPCETDLHEPMIPTGK